MYRSIVLRTVLIAAAVTVTDALLAFPIAFYMAKVASPRIRALLVDRDRHAAVVVSYLVKVYTWRIILAEDGILNWALEPFGLTRARVRQRRHLARLLLPVAAVHDPADLRGARAASRTRCSTRPATSAAARGMTFRRVVLPLALPAVVAGSIFTFSLTLGDYITPQLVSSTQFIGNVVYANVGVANNLPLAAAFATVPVVIMIVYLLGARRLGAFESL